MDIMAQIPVGEKNVSTTPWGVCSSFCTVFRMEIAMATFISGVTGNRGGVVACVQVGVACEVGEVL